MNDTHNNIARKYAVAFLNLYEHELNSEYFKNLNGLFLFLKKNRWFYFYLGMSRIDDSTKQQAINHVGNILNCCHHTSLLINTLIKHKRIELLDSVIEQILSYYNKSKDVEIFTILTSHTLHDNEKDRIIAIIRSLTKHNIQATFDVDSSLICGIKIQSDRSFFERSIARQLKDFEQSILRRVGL